MIWIHSYSGIIRGRTHTWQISNVIKDYSPWNNPTEDALTKSIERRRPNWQKNTIFDHVLCRICIPFFMTDVWAQVWNQIEDLLRALACRYMCWYRPHKFSKEPYRDFRARPSLRDRIFQVLRWELNPAHSHWNKPAKFVTTACKQLCNCVIIYLQKQLRQNWYDSSSVHKTNIFILALVDKEMLKTPAFWEKKKCYGLHV